MSTNGAPPEAPEAGTPGVGSAGGDAPAVLRRLDSASATALAALVETFEELQTVLRCCELLVAELESPGGPDPVLVEAVWTTALLSYARCFSAGPSGVALGEDDLSTAQPGGEVLEWHRLLLQLRDHYAAPTESPRERFSVAVAQDAQGAASGVAITSDRQPLVDDVTVRQTGAVAYALRGQLNARIESQQGLVSAELQGVPRADLDKLEQISVAVPADQSDS